MNLDEFLQNLPTADQIDSEIRRRKENKIDDYYPDDGPLRRELYKKHLAYFKSGVQYTERAIMAANRVGKTEGVGGVETVYHLTGNYPHWWEGKRFDRPIKMWAAGDTSKTTRDIIQAKLLGPYHDIGTGLIPKSCINGKPKPKAGIADAVEIIRVKHVTGGDSIITLKSYDQRREAFQGTEQDIIWLDEEPPQDIYTECLIRIMTTNGMIILTFTPLMGISEVVKSFLDCEDSPSKYMIQATWDDVPHLSQEQKDKLWNSIPPFQRDARSKGIPQLGAGAIYPIDENQMLVNDFEIPDHWPRWYGMDVGWNWTAAVFFTLDRDSDTTYIWSVYKAGQAEPIIHAEAIKARGAWLKGVIDYSGTNMSDGTRIMEIYQQCGLNVDKANKSVEAGIYNAWQMKSLGKVKIFKSCSEVYFAEQRLYRRDEKGKIVKENDHVMDSERYGLMAEDHIKITEPIKDEDSGYGYYGNNLGSNGWMS